MNQGLGQALIARVKVLNYAALQGRMPPHLDARRFAQAEFGQDCGQSRSGYMYRVISTVFAVMVVVQLMATTTAFGAAQTEIAKGIYIADGAVRAAGIEFRFGHIGKNDARTDHKPGLTVSGVPSKAAGSSWVTKGYFSPTAGGRLNFEQRAAKSGPNAVGITTTLSGGGEVFTRSTFLTTSLPRNRYAGQVIELDKKQVVLPEASTRPLIFDGVVNKLVMDGPDGRLTIEGRISVLIIADVRSGADAYELRLRFGPQDAPLKNAMLTFTTLVALGQTSLPPDPNAVVSTPPPTKSALPGSATASIDDSPVVPKQQRVSSSVPEVAVTQEEVAPFPPLRELLEEPVNVQPANSFTMLTDEVKVQADGMLHVLDYPLEIRFRGKSHQNVLSHEGARIHQRLQAEPDNPVCSDGYWRSRGLYYPLGGSGIYTTYAMQRLDQHTVQVQIRMKGDGRNICTGIDATMIFPLDPGMWHVGKSFLADGKPFRISEVHPPKHSPINVSGANNVEEVVYPTPRGNIRIRCDRKMNFWLEDLRPATANVAMARFDLPRPTQGPVRDEILNFAISFVPSTDVSADTVTTLAAVTPDTDTPTPIAQSRPRRADLPPTPVPDADATKIIDSIWVGRDNVLNIFDIKAVVQHQDTGAAIASVEKDLKPAAGYPAAATGDWRIEGYLMPAGGSPPVRVEYGLKRVDATAARLQVRMKGDGSGACEAAKLVLKLPVQPYVGKQFRLGYTTTPALSAEILPKSKHLLGFAGVAQQVVIPTMWGDLVIEPETEVSVKAMDHRALGGTDVEIALGFGPSNNEGISDSRASFLIKLPLFSEETNDVPVDQAGAAGMPPGPSAADYAALTGASTGDDNAAQWVAAPPKLKLNDWFSVDRKLSMKIGDARAVVVERGENWEGGGDVGQALKFDAGGPRAAQDGRAWDAIGMFPAGTSRTPLKLSHRIAAEGDAVRIRSRVTGNGTTRHASLYTSLELPASVVAGRAILLDGSTVELPRAKQNDFMLQSMIACRSAVIPISASENLIVEGNFMIQVEDHRSFGGPSFDVRLIYGPNSEFDEGLRQVDLDVLVRRTRN